MICRDTDVLLFLPLPSPTPPVETGSWDPSLGSFIPTRLLGSSPASGAAGRTRVPAQCVNGFDQAAYIAGLSSNVFNGLNGALRVLHCMHFRFRVALCLCLCLCTFVAFSLRFGMIGLDFEPLNPEPLSL